MRVFGLVLAVFFLRMGASEAAPLRGPSSMVLMDEGKWLVVALERRGGLAVIDAESLKVRNIVNVEGAWTDLAPVSPRRFLGVDREGNVLALFELSGEGVETIAEVEVPVGPVTVALNGVRLEAYVASLWSRKLTVIEFFGTTDLYNAREIELGFEPREQLLLPGGRFLLLADAFNENLAVVDVQNRVVESVRKFPAHNIRGLTLNMSRDRVLVSHQRLNPLARTSFEDVHWGMALTNSIRSIRIEDLMDPQRDLVHQSQLWLLGDVGNAAGDPDAVTVLPDGSIAVAIAGTGEVLLGDFGEEEPVRIETGARPVAVELDRQRNRLFIAAALDDLVSVVDLAERELMATISLTRDLDLTRQERGERLFFNARQSHDGWFSCHSCHTDGHTNGLRADTMGDGGFDTPKRIPSLLGLGGTEPFGWLGNRETLDAQIQSSIHTTMRHDGEDLPDRDLEDLRAFLEQLAPPPSASGARDDGRKIFISLGCADCHSGGNLTSPDTYDVGVTDELGHAEFNPPSLRGVRSRERFGLFHDGRVKSLEDLLRKEKHRLDRDLSEKELDELVGYLRSL